jgi:hypothetical protein
LISTDEQKKIEEVNSLFQLCGVVSSAYRQLALLREHVKSGNTEAIDKLQAQCTTLKGRAGFFQSSGKCLFSWRKRWYISFLRINNTKAKDLVYVELRFNRFFRSIRMIDFIHHYPFWCRFNMDQVPAMLSRSLCGQSHLR